MKIKIFFLLFLLLQITACTGGGGGEHSTPVQEPTSDACVFKDMTTQQTVGFLNKLNQEWEVYAEKKGCLSELDSYTEFSATFTFNLAGVQSKEALENALVDQSLETAVIELFDYQNCRLKDLNNEEIENIKTCKWSKK